MTDDKSLIIVEDKDDEAEKALQTAQKVFESDNIVLVNTLADYFAQSQKRRFDYVLTDLFFPTGDEGLTQKYKDEIVVIYQKFAEDYFPRNSEESPIKNVINLMARAMNKTPREIVYEVIPNNPELYINKGVYECIYDAFNGRKNYKGYEKILGIIDDVKKGINFPSGCYVARSAVKGNSKCIIVTSTNHHDLSFEPLRGRLNAEYVDYLDNDGKKAWGAGLEILLGEDNLRNETE